MALTVESGTISGITTADSGILLLNLASESADAFYDFTFRHNGRIIEVLIDGEVIIAPRLQSPFYGSIPITVPMSNMERIEIIQKLVAGDIVLELRLPEE